MLGMLPQIEVPENVPAFPVGGLFEQSLLERRYSSCISACHGQCPRTIACRTEVPTAVQRLGLAYVSLVDLSIRVHGELAQPQFPSPRRAARAM